MTNCGYNIQSSCTSSYMDPYSNSCITPCTNPYNGTCTNACTPLYTDPCANYCNNYCNNCCASCCNNIPNLPNIDIPPTAHGIIEGKKGPFEWRIEYNIDDTDVTKDYFTIIVSLLGIKIIDTRLDINNPKIGVNLTVSGVGVIAELGVDFTQKIIYFRGKLDFYYYKKDFNFILYKF